ncbi:hypothetical protein DQM68_09060 [Leptospira mayottensis]|nr:hypothetical protein DQM68_09060 [Leptospira mayottensis]AZQ02760.1 hypothetical protein LEP1GSC190_12630 [Leptospira mayottensis 200901116]
MRPGSQNISKESKENPPHFFCGEVSLICAFCFFSVFLFGSFSLILFACFFSFFIESFSFAFVFVSLSTLVHVAFII